MAISKTRIFRTLLIAQLLWAGGRVGAAPSQPAESKPRVWTSTCQLRGLPTGEISFSPNRDEETTEVVLRRGKKGPVVAKLMYPEYIDEPEVDCQGDRIKLTWITRSGQSTRRLQMRLVGKRLVELPGSNSKEKTVWQE